NWFVVNSSLYSWLTHFITKLLYIFLSLSDIFDGCLFNIIKELLILGFGCMHSLGILLNMDISTSVIKSNARERFVLSSLLANPSSTIKYLTVALLSKTIFRTISVLI